MSQVEIFTSQDSSNNRLKLESTVIDTREYNKYHIIIQNDNQQDVSSVNVVKRWFSLEIFNEPIRIEIKKPVYVYKDDSGTESVYYNSRLMKDGHLYEIEWKGSKWALKKTDNEVQFIEWKSNENCESE